MSIAVRLQAYLLTCLLLSASPAWAIPPGGMTSIGHWEAGFCYSMAREGNVLACINGAAVDIYEVSIPGQHILLKRLLYEPSGPSAVFISGGILYVAETSVGLHAYDLSDPSSPALLTTSPISDYIIGGQIVGSYGYFVDDFQDLVILDLSTPSSLVEVGRLSFSESIYALAAAGDVVYVAGKYNLHTIDASDPTNPNETDSLPIAQARDIEIQGDHAFARGGNSGIYAIDLSSPLHPVTESIFPPTSPTNYFTSLSLSGNLAFVCSSSDSLWVIDIGDPTAMVDVARLAPTEFGDGLEMYRTGDRLWIRDFHLGVFELDLTVPLQPAVTDRFPTGSGTISVVSNETTVLAAGSHGLNILDWSIPEAPALLAQLESVGVFRSVCMAGELAFVSDDSVGVRILNVSVPSAPQEIGLAPGNAGRAALLGQDKIAFIQGTQGLRIYDVSDPTMPVLCSEMSFLSILRGIAVQGSLIYLAAADLVIVDASDPYAPLVIGEYDNEGAAFDVAVSGQFAYLAASADGVRVVSVSDPTAPVLATTWNESIPNNTNIVERIELDFPYLRVASLLFGAFVVDVGDPLNPKTVGSIEFFQQFPSGIGHAGPNITLLGQAHGLWFIHDDFAVSATPDTPATTDQTLLLSIHPNPFNPVASIAFELRAREAVSLRVFDLKGHLVKTLLDGEVLEQGRQEVVWNGKGEGNRPMASGTFFFQIEAGEYREVKRGVLVK